jgi:hypothetical protein
MNTLTALQLLAAGFMKIVAHASAAVGFPVRVFAMESIFAFIKAESRAAFCTENVDAAFGLSIILLVVVSFMQYTTFFPSIAGLMGVAGVHTALVAPNTELIPGPPIARAATPPAESVKNSRLFLDFPLFIYTPLKGHKLSSIWDFITIQTKIRYDHCPQPIMHKSSLPYFILSK